jgi:16S rRNA (adenine1518-N6/adenine1519-N6)-dimethyltransferase
VSEPARAAAPSQPSLNRLARFAIRPNRELGQHFLIDSNLLGVVERAARLAEDDVVLEIGGGLGVLSEHLAARVRHVHVVEVDRALAPALHDALDSRPNASLHFADALDLDLSSLRPAPGKVVANLPYGIATTAILRTVAELRGCRLWVAMVQREAGRRLAAGPGGAEYGVPSVLAQLECEVEVLRPVARSVFHPVPNVDSVLVRLRRRPGAEPVEGGLRDLVHAGFAHRRKALARSLSLAPGAGADVRDRTREALRALGHPEDARAERLAPEEFRALHRRLAWP